MIKIFFCIGCLWSCVSVIGVPKAIIFDFGGVMNSHPNRQALDQFIQDTLHLTQSEFKSVSKEGCKASEKGVSDEEFLVSYAQNNKIKLPDNWRESFRLKMKNALGANPEMYALVDQLKKQNLIVGLLSNVDGRCRARRIASAGLYVPFDPCILSCDVGVVKPNPKIYEILLQRLNLPPDQIVFVDDKQANVEVAQKLGIDGILFRSPALLRQELMKRGVIVKGVNSGKPKVEVETKTDSKMSFNLRHTHIFGRGGGYFDKAQDPVLCVNLPM